MRQKVGYLESVNAELCEQLERCDVEALTQQGSLQAEKAELAARMRQLQEEVSCKVVGVFVLGATANCMSTSNVVKPCLLALRKLHMQTVSSCIAC